jgi:hypothetical protein
MKHFYNFMQILGHNILIFFCFLSFSLFVQKIFFIHFLMFLPTNRLLHNMKIIIVLCSCI